LVEETSTVTAHIIMCALSKALPKLLDFKSDFHRFIDTSEHNGLL